MTFTNHQRRILCALFLLGVFVLILGSLAACSAVDTTAPESLELPCANVPTPPDRYAVPHRYADTLYVFSGNIPGTSLYGKLLGQWVARYPDAMHCLTLTDSLNLHPAKP